MILRNPASTGRLGRGLIALLATALMLALTAAPGTSQAQPTSTTSSDAISSTTTVSHPFSDPVWLPLRVPARVDCSKSNCGERSHGYWAIDFLGQLNDPVYAAGAGIAHINTNKGGCRTKAQGVDSGRSIWIDHGAGKVTKYNHLNSIRITNGQRVTPATKIGTVGSTGDIAPCRTKYLHFEVREDGLTGHRIYPGSLFACSSSGRVKMPQSFGVTNWNAHNILKKWTPAGSTACMSPNWNATPAKPTVSMTPGPASVKVAWGTPPRGTNKVIVKLERYATSLKAYGRAYHYTLSGAPTSKTFSKLTNGRPYRATVSFHNAYGNSAWATAKVATPASRPSAPKSPRFLTYPHGKYVHYGWHRSSANGAVVTKYQAAMKCQTKGKYGKWTVVNKSGDVVYHNFPTKKSVCQVMARGANKVGWSKWSTKSVIRK
jgi:hypothetical protein